MPLSPPSSAATPAPQAEDGAVTPLRSQASTSTAASSLQTFEPQAGPPKEKKKKSRYTAAEDAAILSGIETHGRSWKAILSAGTGIFHEARKGSDICARYSTLLKQQEKAAKGKKAAAGSEPVEDVFTGVVLEDIPSAPDEFANAPEVWDIIKVYSAASRAAPDATKCESAGCLIAACALWSSSSEEWNTCEACQAKDFGGWPVDAVSRFGEREFVGKTSEAPLTLSQVNLLTKASEALAIVSANRAVSAATGSTDVLFESETAAIATAEVAVQSADAAIKIAAATSASPIAAVASVLSAVAAATTASTAAQVAASTALLEVENRALDDSDVWDIVGTFSSKEQVHPDAKVCDTDKCPMPACAKWSARGDTNTIWNTCEDCQTSDFGGWPVGYQDANRPAVPPPPQHKVAACPYESADAAMPPMTSFQPSAQAIAADSDSESESSIKSEKKRKQPPIVSPPVAKKSKATSAIQKKWEADAKKLNPDATVITSVMTAKTLIWQKLREIAEPRTLTLLYSDFKNTIPSALLKKALGDMVAAGRKCPNREGLKLRTGKHMDGRDHIYYTYEEKEWPMDVRQDLKDKVRLTGDGMKEDAAELARLTKAASVLAEEPMNRALDKIIADYETEVASDRETVEEARATFVDDGSAKKTKAAKAYYVGEWMARKRKCCDALEMLEGVTEGSISRKKVLNAEGPIEMEGDERVVKQALASAKAVSGRKFGSKRGFAGAIKKDLADPAFVAVRLDTTTNFKVERVYAS